MKLRFSQKNLGQCSCLKKKDKLQKHMSKEEDIVLVNNDIGLVREEVAE